ncbi:phosphoesterase RecJ domain-containing protein [Selenomonas sp. GACV-9]|uniref:DHH family phosphoesterase n=1 Tax=Selenomonas sp. GACV-9 TaxID=3158782 RepID=UPI0008EF4775|nr:phosphoesterase RecJ domain-containing protein [Selenomonas ruminantium]
MKISLRETAAVLSAAQKVVITAHTNPDGDAIGSSLGLMHFLKGLGKDAQVLIDDDIPAIFDMLPGYELLGKPEEGQSIAADVLVALDVSLDRIGMVKDVVKAEVLNIDHHITNDGAADKLYLDGTCAATAEIIYQLIKEMNGTFSRDCAMCLYTGLATDSGWFRYSNTTPATLRAGAELLAAGAEPNLISEGLERRPYESLKGLADALQHMELFHDGRMVGVFLDFATLENIGSAEGLVDMIRKVEGTELAVVLKEKEKDSCRVSMRSKGMDVTKIATQFGGGGHVRAAGCSIAKPFAEAKAALLAAIADALEPQA